MKRIGVLADYLSDAHRREIQEAVDQCNQIAASASADGEAPEPAYELRYYDSAEALEAEIHQLSILYGYVPAKLLKKAVALEWIQTAAAGVDTLVSDDLYAHPESVLLTNANGAYGITIAEHILMVSLMLLRRQPEYSEVVARREWKNLGTIHSLYGSRIAVVGTGDIGTQFARRAKAMGAAHIIGIRRTDKPADPAFDEVRLVAELKEAVADVDLLVLCVPGTRETAGLISAEVLACMRVGAYIVNVGRGSAIDQIALKKALDEGRIAGAALDVTTPEPLPPEDPLYEAKNILITPHISGNMTLGKTCDLNVGIFTRNLLRFAKGEPLHHLVDRTKGY